MPSLERGILAAFLILGGSIWVGGLVTVVVVGRVSLRTLEPKDRVRFFRGLGRVFGTVTGLGLVVALITGGWLLAGRPGSGLTVTAEVAALCLLAATAIGVLQARQMTRLRRSQLTRAEDAALAAQVGRGARLALGLRALIAILSLLLVGLVAALTA